jgi:hypothetical protein
VGLDLAGDARTSPTTGDCCGDSRSSPTHLENEHYTTISEIAAAEKIDRGYVGSILRLSLLAPDIVEAILDGRQPDGLGLPTLLKPFPLEWELQRAKLATTLWAQMNCRAGDTDDIRVRYWAGI